MYSIESSFVLGGKECSVDGTANILFLPPLAVVPDNAYFVSQCNSPFLFQRLNLCVVILNSTKLVQNNPDTFSGLYVFETVIPFNSKDTQNLPTCVNFFISCSCPFWTWRKFFRRRRHDEHPRGDGRLGDGLQQKPGEADGAE